MSNIWALEGYLTPAQALMAECRCEVCGDDAGWSLVCKPCRPMLTPSQRRRIRNKWHEIIRSKGGERGGMVICFHCEEPYPWEETCGDHFPYPVGRRKNLEFDIRNGVPCCKKCNVSNARTRKSPTEFMR